jgi:hypothetical protein
VVSVDAESGEFDVERFLMVHDCGTPLNPKLIDGQVLGGLAQGLGQALGEELVYDPETGQLVNGTMMDYFAPTACDLPAIELMHTAVPSPVTSLGVRGAGEVGTIPAACGAAVATNYYAQPLLHTIGVTFGVPDSTAGLLVTAGQTGYAVGLAFLVPLGDLLERRRLITGMLVVASAALVVAAAAPDFATMVSALAVAGVTTVAAQIVVPMAASLAADNQRGRVVLQARLAKEISRLFPGCPAERADAIARTRRRSPARRVQCRGPGPQRRRPGRRGVRRGDDRRRLRPGPREARGIRGQQGERRPGRGTPRAGRGPGCSGHPGGWPVNLEVMAHTP